MEALWRSRRCCAICKEFAGLDMQVHHIEPEAEGGPNTIENAIPLCTRCHAQVEHYNPNHPVGTKYPREQIKQFRDEWWDAIENNPPGSLPRGDISVAPTTVMLSPIQRSLRFMLQVTNAGRHPLFDVGIRLAFVSGSARPADLTFLLRNHDDLERGFAFGDMVSLDVIGLTGDDGTHPISYMIIRYLPALTTLTIEVTASAPVASQSELVAQVVGFGQIPIAPTEFDAGGGWSVSVPAYTVGTVGGIFMLPPSSP